MTDPNVPITPPHMTASQMKAYASALLHRDPEAIGIVVATIKERWATMFPPKTS